MTVLRTTGRRGRRSHVTVCLVLVACAAATVACGQPNRYASVDGSGVAGRVVMVEKDASADRSPSPLPGVRVQISDMKTAELITEVRTDAEGRFAIAVAPGRYTIKAIVPAGKALMTPVIATVRTGKVTPVTVGAEPPLPGSKPLSPSASP